MRKQAALKVLPPCLPQSAHVVEFSSTSSQELALAGIELDPEQPAILAGFEEPDRATRQRRHCRTAR